MAHETLKVNLTRDWARTQLEHETDGITSVGGLAQRVESVATEDRSAASAPNARRQSLGKLVELSRRRLRLSVEQLAERAKIELRELLAIETADGVAPQPSAIIQLAEALELDSDPLLDLAGLAQNKSPALTESAVRFAARSEPMQALSPDEEAALSWFMGELSKR